RHRGDRAAGPRRPPVPHLPQGAGAGPEEELLHRRAAHPDGQPQGERDQGGADLMLLRYPAPPVRPVKIDPAQTHLKPTFKHSRALIGCRRDPSGQLVFAGAQDNAVVRWELSSGKKALLAGHKSWVRALAFAAREGLLYSGDWRGRILSWPVEGDAPALKQD